ncbi:MAG: calcium:proton antiporter [Myxococcales bacterium SG8_38_1]|nr:MAG: calcium:proton antiporter [Myxococcales bacterium SG8_38_1]
MFYAIAAIIVGFVAVVWGADRFVYGAAGLASNFGVSRVMIGLTVVAFGTSAPEMLVSAMAAAAGSGEMGIGNAIGSNITNVTLVLGASAVVGALGIHSRLLVREIPILFLSMAVSWWFLWDGELSRVEGLILLVGLVGMLVWLSIEGAKARSDTGRSAFDDDDIPDSLPTGKAVPLFLVGLVFLLVGSRILVWGAVELALSLGVTELVVGLTLVALGTSLPELAASVAASRRGEQDIAVGNVVGSNIFNLLGVLALPGIIAPGAVSRSVVIRDFPIMLGATLLLLFMALNERNELGPKRGITLVVAFVVYFVMLFVQPSFAGMPG